ncbi:MAG: RepB family plasmid replication initiator protein, partial [Treponema sp.]|nr:RepB family plasmid replication initiator protein [Treponema sp.]
MENLQKTPISFSITVNYGIERRFERMPELSELSPELSKDSTASKKDRYIQREMTLRNNFTVTKRNVLNNFLPRDLSTQEIRLFNIYLSKINPLDIATRRVRFPLEDFHRIMGFESRVHITYLKGIIDDMLGKVTGLPLGRKEEERFPFFKKCQLDRDGFGEWYIEFDAHDDAVIWLFGFKKHFFKYELWNILRLKSRNQIWLFEALKSIQGFGYRVVSIETLKKVLGIPEEKYAKSFASFNRDVLKVCQSVLAKYTDITFTYEPYGRRGRGGKVFFLKIYVNENKAFIPPSAISRFVELRNPEEIAKNLSRNTFSEEIFDLHSASEEHEPIIKVLVKKQAHEETYHSMTRLEYMDFVTDKKFTESQLKQLDKAMKTQYPRIYNNVGLTVSKFENLFKIAHAAHLEGIIYTDIFRYLLGVIRLSAEEELVDEALDARKLREAKMRTEDRETDQDIGDAVIEGKYKIASSETYELLMSKKARAEGKKHIKEIPITESPEEMRAEIAKRDNAEQLAMKNRIIEQFISNNVKIMQLIEEKQGTRNRIKRKGIEESPKAEEPEKEEIKVKQQDNSQEDNKKTESAEKEQIMTEEAKIEPEENPISEEDRRWIRQAMERDRAKARAIIAKKEEEDRIRAEKELEYLDPDRPPVGRTEELVWYMMQKSKIKTRAAKKAEIGSETKNEGEISETQLSREKREEELLIQLEEKLMGRKLTEEEEDEDLEIFIPERYSDGSPVRPRGFERWVRDFHEAKLSGYLRWIIKGIDLKLSAEEKNLSKTNKGFYIFLRDFSRRYRLAPIAETESKDSENPDSELVEKSKFDAECLNSESFFERTGQTELLERVRSIRLGYRPGKMASDGDKWLHEAIIDKNGNPILYFFGFSIVSQEEIEEIEREIKKTWLSFDDSPPRERPPNAVITQEEFDEVQEIRKWHENPQGISPMERKRNEEKEEKLQDELLKSYGEPQEQVTRILSQEELDAYYEKENMRRDKEEAKRLQQEQEDNNYTDEYNNEYDRYDANGNYDPEFGEYNILGEHVGAKEYVYRYGDQFDFTDYEEARKDPEHMKKIEENYAKMLRDIEGFIKEEIAKKEKEHLLILLENPDDPDLPERLMRELMEFEDSLRNPPENFISPIEIQHQEQLARAEALKGLEHGIEVLLMFEKRSEVTQEEKIKILKKIIGESILTEPEKEELFQRATVGPWEKPSPPEPDEPEEEEEPIKIIYAEGERLRREKEGIKPPERWWNEKPSPMSAAA